MKCVPTVVDSARRPVIISLHGIRTAGAWQKTFVTPLAAAGAIPVALDFGYFSALQLITRRQREQRVMWLRDEVERVRARFPDSPMSIVAHSFGSYLTAALLESHPSVGFETVIFSGSIVRRDFPWHALLESRRVGFVANYVGPSDLWPRVARWVVGGAGDSGSVGFSERHPALYQHYAAGYAHADYFNPLHFEHFWLPALLQSQRALLDDLLSLRERVRQALRAASAPEQARVRCRLFVSHPARPGRYWTMPGMQAVDPEVPYTPHDLGYVLSWQQARERPGLLPPALHAVAGSEPVVWVGNSASTEPYAVAAAIAYPLRRCANSATPSGLLSLELLSRPQPSPRSARFEDIALQVLEIMRTFQPNLSDSLQAH